MHRARDAAGQQVIHGVWTFRVARRRNADKTRVDMDCEGIVLFDDCSDLALEGQVSSLMLLQSLAIQSEGRGGTPCGREHQRDSSHWTMATSSMEATRKTDSRKCFLHLLRGLGSIQCVEEWLRGFQLRILLGYRQCQDADFAVIR